MCVRLRVCVCGCQLVAESLQGVYVSSATDQRGQQQLSQPLDNYVVMFQFWQRINLSSSGKLIVGFINKVNELIRNSCQLTHPLILTLLLLLFPPTSAPRFTPCPPTPHHTTIPSSASSLLPPPLLLHPSFSSPLPSS